MSKPSPLRNSIQTALPLGRALRLVWQTAPTWTLVNGLLFSFNWLLALVLLLAALPSALARRRVRSDLFAQALATAALFGSLAWIAWQTFLDLRALDLVQWQREVGVTFQDYAHYALAARENIWLGNVEAQPDPERIAKAGSVPARWRIASI